MGARQGGRTLTLTALRARHAAAQAAQDVLNFLCYFMYCNFANPAALKLAGALPRRHFRLDARKDEALDLERIAERGALLLAAHADDGAAAAGELGVAAAARCDRDHPKVRGADHGVAVERAPLRKVRAHRRRHGVVVASIERRDERVRQPRELLIVVKGVRGSESNCEQ